MTQKSYKFPVKSLPSLEATEHLKDLCEIRDFLEGRGIQTKNTRIARYLEYFKKLVDEGAVNGPLIFKNSKDGPFKSSGDWYLYTLREVHELMWILRGLKVCAPKGIDDKLKVVVGGRDFAALDSNSLSRNIQFELRIASYYCQAGCDVDLSGTTDIVAFTKKHAFYTECKRVASFKQLERRLSEAEKQLTRIMPRRKNGRIAVGCIAADVTKVAFAHSGLTFGLTNEHSRDVIQEKLMNIANTANRMPLFSNCKNLFQYWLQIHIPAQITYPPSSVTRFSSYFLYEQNPDRKKKRAIKSFNKIFINCSKGDGRESQPEELKRNTSVTVPKGSTFEMDETLFNEYITTGLILERENHCVVGELEMDGIREEFNFLEFKILTATIPNEKRIKMAKDICNSRIHLILEMYLQRHPFNEN